MQFSGSDPAFGALALLAGLFSAFTTIFWLVIGWRAMRAHEEIAAGLRERRNPPV